MLVRILLFITLWLATLPTDSQTQQSIPDYVGQAPADVHKYYPQYEAYFKTIFDKINTLKPHSITLLNEEIHETMELFEEDIKSEKDKRTIILMALEMLIVGKKEFTKAKDVQGAQGDNDYKFEIAESIEDGATRKAKWEREQSQKELEQSQKELEQSQKELEQSQKELEQSQKRYDRIKAKNAKIEELIAITKRVNDQGANKEGMEQITKKIEEYFALFSDEELKADLEQNEGIAKIIKQYINYNKQIGRTPSALGQKIINEYNKYQK